MRRIFLFSAFLACLSVASPAAFAASASETKATAGLTDRFSGFVERLWPLARARGVSRFTFDGAFKGMTPDAEVVALTKKQSEFVKPIWDYLATATSAARIERGTKALLENEQAVAAVESRYGVDRSVILGVWAWRRILEATQAGKM